MSLEKLTYPLFGNRSLHVAYYTEVKNSPALRQGLLDKKFDVAMINAHLIAGPFQVHSAALRALQCDASNRLTTRSLHAELVFNMSGSRNVSESLKRFGFSNDTTLLLVCVFDADDEKLKAVETLVEGNQVPFSKLGSHLTSKDLQLIKKYYKISELELTQSSLEDAATCRIATKSCSK
ncbi:kinase binding protein cgi-121 domain containing protein [Plasmopara halstedii]|uniref:Kinase binding protein cgi-121 domain containing protein n=1 Tax=Plasmopara halstedii TaxID=4781 RepID=A0A0P1AX23_PLAHL|nr:kinase binding protein cgi-121 domain containing protein [Plasmopara halstedii]CEG45718.1 kinase binding protein cgi-121 domain containing protein [Plasmopara halstedii]|eukprot:XP_024582087.1 kinase binding protein cgi-121 domain containing protein [Plasmopara halstedii]